MGIKFELSPIGRVVWEDRYALKDENGKLLEKDVTETFSRVAKAIASKEKAPSLWEEKFYGIMADHYFCPAGRILAHSGTHYSQILNCFVLPFEEDSLESIMETAKKMAVIFKFGGGVGFNYSNIRPNGSYIKGVNGHSCGVPGFIHMNSCISEVIEQGGSRRSASLGLLEVWHPDIWEFISFKNDHNWERLREFVDVKDQDKWQSFKHENLYKWQMYNISVGVNDEFFEALENDDFWSFKWGGHEWGLYKVRFKKFVKEGEYKDLDFEVTAFDEATALWKTKNKVPFPTIKDKFEIVLNRKIKAKELWDKICYNAWADGCPGLINLSTARRMHNIEYANPILSTNPCLHGSTPVAVADGRNAVTIRQLAEEGKDIPVYCRNDKGNVTIRMMRNPRITGYGEKMYKIKLDDGSVVKATGNHKFLLSDGCYIPVSEMRFGDSLHIMVKKRASFNHRVVSVEPCESGTVYNGTVDEFHNFYFGAFSDLTKKEGTVFTNGKNCGEQLLSEYSSCNLSSLILPSFVHNKEFDFSLFEEVVATAARFGDNVIDNCAFPIPEIGKKAKEERRVGLGLMGVHDALIALKLDYGSDKGRKFIEDVLIVIRDTAYKTSIELAKEKGSFPLFKKKEFLKSGFIKTLPESIQQSIKDHGIRNSTLLTVAPTGTTSALCGVSSGCEPWFSLSFTRNTRLGSFEDGCPSYIKWCNNNKGLPKPSYFKTSQEILPEDHIKMLQLFSKYVCSSVSKCVAKGTLIQTNKGVLPIEGLSDFNYKNPEVFSTLNDDYRVLDENGDLKKITKHYYGGKKPCYRIRFNNGFELIAAGTHLLKTGLGWKSIEDLSVGEKVLYRTSVIGNDNELLSINSPDFCNNIKRKFPSHFTENYAEFLGMWLADGSVTDLTLSVCKKNDDVVERLQFLIKDLFGIDVEPAIDKRNGLKTCIINSTAIASYFKRLYGYNSVLKKMPVEIMTSPISVQKALLKGLFLDGYVMKDRVSLVFYEGYSKDIVDKTASLLAAMGIRYYIGRKDVLDGTLSKESYGIRAFLTERVFSLVEEHKNAYKLASCAKWPVFVGEDTRDIIFKDTPSSKDPLYQLKYNMRLSLKKDPFIKQEYLEKAGYALDFDNRCVKITDKEFVGLKDVYDIEVEDTHSYLINGIVSHNTINLPNSATVEDVDKSFLTAMTSGVKGITVFRDGCKEGVLVNKKKDLIKEAKKVVHDLQEMREEEPVESRMSPRKRGGKTVGSTYRVYMRGHNLYITVNRNEAGKLVEVFATVGENKSENSLHTSGVEDSWAEGLAKMISLALRAGVDTDSVIRNLKNIPSDKPVFTSVGDEGSEHIPSPPHAIARAIEEELLHPTLQGIKAMELKRPVCENCGSKNTVPKSPTCYYCLDCPFDKCG